jgi:hypothetical protein
VSVILSDFNQNLYVSTKFSQEFLNTKFHANLSGGVASSHGDTKTGKCYEFSTSSSLCSCAQNVSET